MVAEGGDGHAGSGNVDASNPMRSVYLPVVRDQPNEALKLFDFPDANITSAGRSESIVPTQALFMMNSDFAAVQASGMARLIAGRYRTRDDQIRHAFLWAYGRPPTAGEEQAASQFFNQYQPIRVASVSTSTESSRSKSRKGGKGRKKGGKNGDGSASTGTSASVMNSNQTLTVFCQTLMASARFRILN